MTPQLPVYDFASQLLTSKDYFERSTRVIEESDSEFRPQEGMLTVAQQVAHTAQTLGWFIEGVSRPGGFDLDFEKHAKQMLETAYANAIHFIRSLSPEDLARPLPGPVMSGQPASDVVWGIVEHTAHHRGALTVYSRSLGKVPPMPNLNRGQ